MRIGQIAERINPMPFATGAAPLRPFPIASSSGNCFAGPYSPSESLTPFIATSVIAMNSSSDKPSSGWHC